MYLEVGLQIFVLLTPRPASVGKSATKRSEQVVQEREVTFLIQEEPGRSNDFVQTSKFQHSFEERSRWAILEARSIPKPTSAEDRHRIRCISAAWVS